MPDAGALLATALLIGAGALLTWFLIRSLRHATYRRWSRLSRWLFYGVTATLAGCGAYVLVGVWSDRWGWPTAIWLLAAPFAYGLATQWLRRRRASDL